MLPLFKQRLSLPGRLLLAIMVLSLAREALAAKPKPEAPAPPPPALADSAEGRFLRQAWEEADYQFTPTVKAAYLSFAKAQARQAVKAAGQSLPADFLQWVDSDPVVQTTVYGARREAAPVLLTLRSLEIDLGTEAVRRDYTQLALALAVVNARKGLAANLNPRPPLKLEIPPCPLKPVNTKDPQRPLDQNDHIINFLNENFIEEVPPKHRWAPDKELVYDEDGIAIPEVIEADKAPAAGEKVRRPLTAADVMASRALQVKFNAYMKAKGFPTDIDCGDQVIFPNRREMITGAAAGPIRKAYQLFKKAYEEKGLLPAARDPSPSPAEAMAFLVRNDKLPTPDVAAKAKQKLPKCPLTAPWPILTFLAADDQPLRERQDIWDRYYEKGELHTYGEYIGGIAQQFDFQSARRLCPYPFSYGTFQMMLKDGGVCGTMANMGVRTYKSLGIPASTAGQPGHCALVYFAIDPKSKAYECKGGQFATGGPKQTGVHVPWLFGDIDARRGMIHHQTVAWGVNYGLQAYLDATVAYQFYQSLTPADREAHGAALLRSGLRRNPYSFLLAEAAQADARTPQAQVGFYKYLEAQLAVAGKDKPGCPTDGLYNETVRDRLYAKLAALPVPTDQEVAGRIYAFLVAEKCDNAKVLALYQVAVEGLPALQARTREALAAHLASSSRSDDASQAMKEALDAAVAQIPDKLKKKAWAHELYQLSIGRENGFGKKNKIVLDPAVAVLAKLAGEPLRSEAERMKSLLDRLVVELRSSVAGQRDPKGCKAMAAKIAAAGEQLGDDSLRQPWAAALAQVMDGHEQFLPSEAKKNAKPQRDPCADAIAKLSKAPAAAAPSLKKK